ncbi:MAG: hypothetical protein OXF41_07040 [bacterium]|nr:hypothetical protein [bacterium]
MNAERRLPSNDTNLIDAAKVTAGLGTAARPGASGATQADLRSFDRCAG